MFFIWNGHFLHKNYRMIAAEKHCIDKTLVQ